MNRITCLIASAGLFGFSALMAWMTQGEAAFVPRTPARDPAGVVRRRARPVRTPQEWRTQFEKNLTGSAAFNGGPFSGKEFERLMRASWLFGGPDIAGYAEAWVRHDPDSARAWLESLLTEYSGGLDDTHLREKTSFIFDAWVQLDPEAALAAAPRFSQKTTRRQALVSVLQRLWQTDPDRARAVYSEHLDLFVREQDFRFSLPDGEEGKRYLEFLQSLPPGSARTNLLAVAMDGAALSSDRTAAASFWKTASPELQREILSAGFLTQGRLRYYDPYKKEILDAFPGVEARRREQAEMTRSYVDMRTVVFEHGGSWAERDMPGLIAWVQQYGGQETAAIEQEVFEVAARNNFDATLRSWREMPDSDLKYQAIGVLHRNAGSRHIQETKALIDALTPAQRDQARHAAGY